MGLIYDISELPGEVRRELVQGRYAKDVQTLAKAPAEQEALAAELHDRGLREGRTSMDGMGAPTLEITPEAYHYWGQRMGYECWNDKGFIAEFKRDNPAARVKAAGTRIQTGWSGNVRSRTRFA